MSILYADIPGVVHPTNITVSSSHSVSTTSIDINALTTTLDIGDFITVELGYTTNHPQVFSGYVKQIQKNVPENTVTITAADKMIRAVDYFIVADDPNNLVEYKNIAAEDLVETLMGMAGLTNFTCDPTFFTFGISHGFNVNLAPVFDYCRAIADALTWHLWCDSAGLVHFENRKPFVMTGDTGQPGDTTDETPLGVAAHTIEHDDSTSVYWSKDESHLRNKVVVYGVEGVHASASAVSPYLPAGFYKAMVADLSTIIDSNSMAQNVANYNLHLMNRLTYGARTTIVGDPTMTAREIVRLRNTWLGIDSNWYIYSCEHQWGAGGFTTTLDLRQ